PSALAGSPGARGTNASAAGARSRPGPGTPGNRPIDPNSVATSYENLSRPAKLALPAVLAANANQQRLQAEMQDASPDASAARNAANAGAREDIDVPGLMPTKDGLVQITQKLIESKTVTRKVMKDPPKKSALNGDVNASSSAAVANEILN